MIRVMVFAVAFMANTFAMMVVMIGLSLFGKSGLAADFGLIHGATVALFYSFSGNARSLVLAESEQINASSILRLRLILLLPLGMFAWALCVPMVDGSGLFVLLLVVRRASEWVAEIFLSEQELKHQHTAAMRFLLVQGGLSLALLLVLLNDGSLTLPTIFLWALSPLLVCLTKEVSWRVPNGGAPLIISIRLLLPHFGSTAVIGISVYVFRLFILLITDKQAAGDLFSAFALGGILGAVFSQALGPTMVRQERQSSAGRLQQLFNLTILIMMLAGAGGAASAWMMPQWFEWTGKSQLFWLAVGCSLVGGGVMVLAQRIRLRILQGQEGGDVFGSDMLSNLLLVSCIPFLFYGVGVQALSLLYLVGALFSWMFYSSESHGLLPRRDTGWLAREKVLLVIAFLVFVPLFFQFRGGVFDDHAMSFSSGGILTKLPVPFSILICYLGILLLGSYSWARLALMALFFVFVGMLFSSLLVGLSVDSAGGQKLILLFQYIIPMFAMVLGQQYGDHERRAGVIARAASLVLLFVVPLQLLVTIVNGDISLSPSVYFFSIYQHLLYVPVLFVALFLLALFTLWEQRADRVGLAVLSVLLGAYVVLSWSLLAGVLLVIGVSCFVFQQRERMTARGIWLLPMLTIAGSLTAMCYVYYSWHVQSIVHLARGDMLPLLDGELIYLKRWLFYVRGVCSGWEVFLFGHERVPARELHPSALNYYLDFAYNFGLLGLLPLILLILYSIFSVWRYRGEFWKQPSLMGLALVVLFMLLVDNNFKVGLRQPYSGVIVFFLWGRLLSVISNFRKSRTFV